MILLNRLELKNFLSHVHTVLEFTTQEKILIDGKSGAGKSSLVEAVVWGLFNNGRVNSRLLVKRGAKEATVSIKILDTDLTNTGGTTFDIVRKITAKGTHTVEVSMDGHPVKVSGTRNLQEYIEKNILKCSYELFINSVCRLQDQIDNFAQVTPARRKDLILELVHAEDYDIYHEKTKEKIQLLENGIVSDMAFIERAQHEIADTAQIVAELPEHEIEFLDSNSRLEKLEKELTQFQERELEILRLENKIKISDERLSQRGKELGGLEQDKQNTEAQIEQLEKMDSALIQEKIIELQQTKNQVSAMDETFRLQGQWKSKYIELLQQTPPEPNYKPLIKQLNEDIIVLQQKPGVTETCPNCGTQYPCSLINEHTQTRLKELETRLVALYEEERSAMERYSVQLIKIKEWRDSEPEFDNELYEKLRQKIRTLTPYETQSLVLATREEQLVKLQAKLLSLRQTISLVLTDVENIKAEKTEQEKLLAIQDSQQLRENKILTLRQLEETKAQHQWILGIVTSGRQAKERSMVLGTDIEKIRKKIVSIQKDSADLALLKEAFGVNGIRAIVIDYLIPELEGRINRVLEKLSDFRLRIDTQRANIEGDKNIEGLFLSVVNAQGEEFDLVNYSGGEKMRILIAISEGLAELQKIGFRILDEAVVGLDDETVDGFLNALLLMGERFSQLICISHIGAVKNEFEHIIKVINTNGNSQIQNDKN